MVMSPAGLGLEIECAGEVQRGCYVRTITASNQLESKITGPESQGACRQDELIGFNR
jgi:hypothetical protein